MAKGSEKLTRSKKQKVAFSGCARGEAGYHHYLMGEKPTLQIIADTAGVSKMTVSRVLRNYPFTTTETREKVWDAIKKTGYQPNPMVSAFMTYVRSGRKQPIAEEIACLVMNPHHESNPKHPGPNTRTMIQGARERAEETGFHLEVIEIGPHGCTTARAGTIMRARGIRGVIIAPLTQPRGYLRLPWKELCAVSVSRSLMKPVLPQVLPDQYNSMLLVLRELRRLGYKRMGVAIPLASDQRTNYSWSAGFLTFERLYSLGAKVPCFIPEEWTALGFLKWWRKYRPDVVISTEMSAFEWLGEAGCRIPGDVGFVNLNWHHHAPEFSGIDQLHANLGREVVSFISERLYRNEIGLLPHPPRIVIEGRWNEGKTVCAQ